MRCIEGIEETTLITHTGARKLCVEAPSGVEPLHRSFADCSLNHLGTAPSARIIVWAGGERLAQDAEKVRQRRSRFAQKLNVPKRTPRLFAHCGLAGRPF